MKGDKKNVAFRSGLFLFESDLNPSVLSFVFRSVIGNNAMLVSIPFDNLEGSMPCLLMKYFNTLVDLPTESFQFERYRDVLTGS